MPAEDHLRNAASELQRATDVLRQEIAQLKADEGKVKQLTNTQLVQLEQQVKLTEQQIQSADSSAHTGQLQQLVSKLRTQINQVKSETDREVKRIAEMIAEKEKMINNIQQQARSVGP